MVKCLCRVTNIQQQQADQHSQQQHAQQQQQPYQPGQHVFLFVQSKASHAVDLGPGSCVRVHPPWYEVVLQQPGQPPVLLAYLLSAGA